MQLPIFVPPRLNGESVAKYLEESIKANQYSNFGPLHTKLTHRLADYLGIDPENLILASNATVALEAAISTANEDFRQSVRQTAWRIPSWTFAATGQAALRAGVAFEFGDVTSDEGILTVEPGDQSIDNLGVIPFGGPIERMTNDGFRVVDAAASFDALAGSGRQFPSTSGVVVSLHATKVLSAGEGGLFFSTDRDWVSRVKSYLMFGFEGASRESVRTGTNGKMNEVSAAMALASMDAWHETRDRWAEVSATALRISEARGFETFGGLSHGLVSPYWMIKLDTPNQRERFEKHLQNAGVSSRRWWSGGLHKMPVFGKIQAPGGLDATEDWSSRYVGLPLFPDMTVSDLSFVSRTLNEFRAN